MPVEKVPTRSDRRSRRPTRERTSSQVPFGGEAVGHPVLFEEDPDPPSFPIVIGKRDPKDRGLPLVWANQPEQQPHRGRLS